MRVNLMFVKQSGRSFLMKHLALRKIRFIAWFSRGFQRAFIYLRASNKSPFSRRKGSRKNNNSRANKPPNISQRLSCFCSASRMSFPVFLFLFSEGNPRQFSITYEIRRKLSKQRARPLLILFLFIRHLRC